MAEVTTLCPHCMNNSGFQIVSAFKPTTALAWACFCKCRSCEHAVIVAMQGGTSAPTSYEIPAQQGWKIVDVLPRPKVAVAPSHLPGNIQSLYLEAMDIFHAKKMNGAAAVFRKAMETALKTLAPDGKGSLYDRIEKLPPEIGVTTAMKEWAHQVRLIGRDAVHDEDDPTDRDVADMQAFTELFLTYAFTLPGMLDARRPKSD